ncbi:MAG: YwbE family protein [Clostridia bacterium]|nr:YwbE family protein [Clostridia bacterium]
MDGRYRKNVPRGCLVDIVLKKDQRTGRLTRGRVKNILTNSAFHPRGIKVRLEDGRIGRVQKIILCIILFFSLFL